MTTIKELMHEHRELNPDYEGSPVAPLPTRPEKDPSYTQVPWEKWERQQKDATAWVKDLEEYND